MCSDVLPLMVTFSLGIALFLLKSFFPSLRRSSLCCFSELQNPLFLHPGKVMRPEEKRISHLNVNEVNQAVSRPLKLYPGLHKQAGGWPDESQGSEGRGELWPLWVSESAPCQRPLTKIRVTGCCWAECLTGRSGEECKSANKPDRDMSSSRYRPA